MLIAGALGGFPGSAEGQQLSALASASFSSFRASQGDKPVQLDFFNATLDTNWSMAISPVLSYRLGFNVTESDSRSVDGESVSSIQATTIEPSMDVTLRGPQSTVSVGGRMLRQFLFGNKTERDEPGEMSLFIRGGWTPDRLPQVDLQYEHLFSDDFHSPVTRDRDQDRLHAALRYSIWKVSLNYTLDLTLTDDHELDLEQTQWEHRGILAYADSYFGDRLALNLTYQPTYRSSNNRFGIPSSGTFPRQISGPFSGLEPNPLTTDPSTAPLTPAPQLLDGNLTTGVPLQVNQPVGPLLGNTSVGFEVPTGDALSTIHVVANPGFNPTQGSAISFRVFQSGNRINWTEIIGVTQTFNQFQNRFELTFAPTTARFLKAFVATNTSVVPVQAVELEALGPGTSRQERELSISSWDQVLTGGLTLRPVAFGSLSYYFTVRDVRQDPGNQRATDWSQTASLTVTPHPLVTSAAVFTRAVNDSNSPTFLDTTNDTLSLSISSTPLPTLTGNLFFTHIDAYRGDAKESTSNGGGLTLTSQLYRNLSGDVTVSATRIRDVVAGSETTNYSGVFNLNAMLTERLLATLGYALGLSETGGPDGLQRGQSGYLNLSYTINRLVTLRARFDVANAGGTTAFTQQYGMDWNPSDRLSFFASYSRASQFLSGQTLSAQSGGIAGRWSISRYFDLNLGYQYAAGITGDHLHTVTGTLSFRL